ncbi:unnamed protein product [Thlaspi arvense]|uniref:Uncharacterized protein n=1 Tax=Thlaspi arvense TaxID=13288 RepID=A0AAU9S7A2_THLAR|nr:unnamed protein product [Thlaspi arvense]
MDAISERLSELENLYFPCALQPSANTPSQRKSSYSTSSPATSRSAKIKNWRLTYMDRLMNDGQDFSEDERERHTCSMSMQGSFGILAGGAWRARPGERWWETLMRRSVEAMLV